MEGSPAACCGLGARQNNSQLPKRRIAIIGQTGAGKSSLGNTIFKEKKFNVNHDEDPGMRRCDAKTKRVGGTEITLIDMPGLFDPQKDEKELKAELLKGITECSPGPHAFLIVLNMEKSTDEDDDIVSKMNEHLSDEVLKYSTVVFTHGDRLPRRQRIQGFVKGNKSLSDFVEKCGNRCHVVDNDRWNKRWKYGYRSNRYQVKKLLKSIEKTVEENDRSFYTNAMLQKIEESIKQEEEHIAKSSRNIPLEKIREMAKERTYADFLNKLAGITAGALLGAAFGLAVAVSMVVALLATTVRVITSATKSWSAMFTKPALDTTASAAPDKTMEAEKEAVETGEPPAATAGKEGDAAAGIEADAAVGIEADAAAGKEANAAAGKEADAAAGKEADAAVGIEADAAAGKEANAAAGIEADAAVGIEADAAAGKEANAAAGKEADAAAGKEADAAAGKEADAAVAEKPAAVPNVVTTEVARKIGEASSQIGGALTLAVGVATAAGAFLGGVTGYNAAENAKTPWEAAEKAAQAVSSSGFTAIEKSQNLASDLVKAVLKPLSNES